MPVLGRLRAKSKVLYRHGDLPLLGTGKFGYRAAEGAGVNDSSWYPVSRVCRATSSVRSPCLSLVLLHPSPFLTSHRISTFCSYKKVLMQFCFFSFRLNLVRGVDSRQQQGRQANPGGVTCWMAELNATLWLVTRARQSKYYIFYFKDWEGNPQHVAFADACLCPCA